MAHDRRQNLLRCRPGLRKIYASGEEWTATIKVSPSKVHIGTLPLPVPALLLFQYPFSSWSSPLSISSPTFNGCWVMDPWSGPMRGRRFHFHVVISSPLPLACLYHEVQSQQCTFRSSPSSLLIADASCRHRPADFHLDRHDLGCTSSSLIFSSPSCPLVLKQLRDYIAPSCRQRMIAAGGATGIFIAQMRIAGNMSASRPSLGRRQGFVQSCSSPSPGAARLPCLVSGPGTGRRRPG